MDGISRASVAEAVKKYRYGIAVLIVGIALMLLPEKEGSDGTQAAAQVISGPTVQQSLEEILSQVAGAGKVTVLLTEKAGEQILYQTDDTLEKGENSVDQMRKTVMTTAADRTETGLIRQIIPPEYRGAVVVCQGAEDPKVKLAMVEAVMGATGLPSNCIRVLKMK